MFSNIIKPILLVGLVLFLLSTGVGELTYDDNKPVTLSLFHNNDGESNLTEKDGYGSAAVFVSLLNKVREEARLAGNATLTLSSGDNFLAGTAFSASTNTGEYHDAKVLNAIGYDAITLGNHDFDFGPDVLAEFIQSVDESVPFLSANLDFSKEKELSALVQAERILTSTVVESNGSYFGIIGATTTELATISSPRNVSILADVVAVIQAEVDRLTKIGINKIVLVSHLQGIGAEKAVVQQLKNVDIVIAGGGDELLANEGDLLLPQDQETEPYGTYPLVEKDSEERSVPIVTTPGEYKYIGRMEASFDAQGNLIEDVRGSLLRVAGPSSRQADAIRPDQEIQKNAVDPVLQFEKSLKDNVLAQTEVTLDGTRQLVRSQETNFGSLVGDAILWQSRQLYKQYGLPKPDIAISNGGGIRNSVVINAGESITELDTFTALPFPNFVVVVPNVSPEQLRLVMENAVSQIEDTKGRFAQISGFKIEVDVSRPALIINKEDGSIEQEGERILSIQLDDGQYIVQEGNVLGSAPSINIATLGFLARGGDQYPFRGADFTTVGVTYQQSLASYLSASSSTGGLEGTVSEAQYSANKKDRISFR